MPRWYIDIQGRSCQKIALLDYIDYCLETTFTNVLRTKYMLMATMEGIAENCGRPRVSVNDLLTVFF